MGNGSILSLVFQAFVYCFVSVLCIWCSGVCLKLGQWFNSYLSSLNLWPAALCLLCVLLKGEPRTGEDLHTEESLYPHLPFPFTGSLFLVPSARKSRFLLEVCCPGHCCCTAPRLGAALWAKPREKRETHEHSPSIFSSPQGPFSCCLWLERWDFYWRISWSFWWFTAPQLGPTLSSEPREQKGKHTGHFCKLCVPAMIYLLLFTFLSPLKVYF